MLFRSVLRRTGYRAASATAVSQNLRVEVNGGALVAEVRVRLEGGPLAVSLGAHRRVDAERLAEALRGFRAGPG